MTKERINEIEQVAANYEKLFPDNLFGEAIRECLTALREPKIPWRGPGEVLRCEAGILVVNGSISQWDELPDGQDEEWQAMIYESDLLATLPDNLKAIEFYGEFAVLNYPETGGGE